MSAAAEFDSARVASPCNRTTNNGGNIAKCRAAGTSVRLCTVMAYKQGHDTARRRPRGSGLGNANVSTMAGREDRITGRHTVEGITRPYEKVDSEAPPHCATSLQYIWAHDNATEDKWSDMRSILERFVREMEAKKNEAIDTVFDVTGRSDKGEVKEAVDDSSTAAAACTIMW